MLPSPEIQNTNLEMIYGSEVRAIPELKCFQNAFHALFHIYKETNGAILPRVWRVDFNNPQDNHAYLQIGNDIYNKGITWPDNKYPDYNLEQLKSIGVDHTTTVITQALLEWDGRNKGEEMGFKKAIELLGYTDKETISKTLDHMISQSVIEERHD